MVQERLGSALAKGSTFQPPKKEKDGMAASMAPQSSVNKSSGKYGTWGPVFKSKQNFVDMHYS